MMRVASLLCLDIFQQIRTVVLCQMTPWIYRKDTPYSTERYSEYVNYYLRHEAKSVGL